jgi:hypothetical protein
MKRAKEIIKKGLININTQSKVTAETYNINMVKHVIEEQNSNIVEFIQLYYEGCISPMVISMEEYECLMGGELLELHQEAVYILFR